MHKYFDICLWEVKETLDAVEAFLAEVPHVFVYVDYGPNNYYVVRAESRGELEAKLVQHFGEEGLWSIVGEVFNIEEAQTAAGTSILEAFQRQDPGFYRRG